MNKKYGKSDSEIRFKALVEYSSTSDITDPAYYTWREWEYYTTLERPEWLDQKVLIKVITYQGYFHQNC